MEPELIYDWNRDDEPPLDVSHVLLHDETLRDGIQDASVVDPRSSDKADIVRAMAALGIQSVDLGIPSAGSRAEGHCRRLAKVVADEGLPIQAACAGRTLVPDLERIVEISQASGISIEVMTFIGASPIRQRAESWSEEGILKRSTDAIAFAVREGLPVTFVTEDTTRSHPALLEMLFKAALDTGAHRLCLCDTVGHATPAGTHALVSFAKRVVEESGTGARIDWHGHNDRGLALANSLAAISAGADRIHGCVLGIGERVGNASLDQLWLNLTMMRGELDEAGLGALKHLCEIVSRSTDYPIPADYPVLGANAFKTGTGVHASAIFKARAQGGDALADRVYSSVPAGLLGRRQEVCIGPMSGLSNVRYWLRQRGHRDEHDVAEAILSAAKAGDRNLRDAEIEAIIARVERGAAE